jgi:hypothetical protein
VPAAVPDNPPDSTCSFCGRPRSTTGPMVEGPDQIFMCALCVDVASLTVANLRNDRCSFCGRPCPTTGPMVEGPSQIFMCALCVDAASVIIADLRKDGRLPPSKLAKSN